MTSNAIVRGYANKNEYDSGNSFFEIELEVPKGLSVRETVEYIYAYSHFPILSDGNTPVPGVSEEIWNHESEIGYVEWQDDGSELTWIASKI